LVDRLKGEEAQLRSRQRKAEAERERLSAEIRNMIEAELAAERASAEGEFALTPEGRIVSAEFERNKAGLPWPVLRGVVTQRFGRQAHPTLPGIFIDNNGVDISTDENTAVLAAFHGEVTSIFEIPGAGATVILSHGAYRSVYSNVHSIAVQKGSKVDVGQVLAKTRGGNAGAVLHFEIWHVSEGGQTPQAPRLWLVPR
jgi:murein DD-endopeptidase MepM/ murein hydrolase activator NlpD